MAGNGNDASGTLPPRVSTTQEQFAGLPPPDGSSRSSNRVWRVGPGAVSAAEALGEVRSSHLGFDVWQLLGFLAALVGFGVTAYATRDVKSTGREKKFRPKDNEPVIYDDPNRGAWNNSWQRDGEPPSESASSTQLSKQNSVQKTVASEAPTELVDDGDDDDDDDGQQSMQSTIATMQTHENFLRRSVRRMVNAGRRPSASPSLYDRAKSGYGDGLESIAESSYTDDRQQQQQQDDDASYYVRKSDSRRVSKAPTRAARLDVSSRRSTYVKASPFEAKYLNYEAEAGDEEEDVAEEEEEYDYFPKKPQQQQGRSSSFSTKQDDDQSLLTMDEFNEEASYFTRSTRAPYGGSQSRGRNPSGPSSDDGDSASFISHDLGSLV